MFPRIRFKKVCYMHSLKLNYLLILIISLIITIGCSSVPQETVMMKNVEGVKMTAVEIDIRLNEFGKYFMSSIEEASEEIIIKSDDIKIKMNALQWRLNVIPSAIQALAISDPVAAGTDIWALCAQQQQYFTDGYGKDIFGKYQYIAIDVSNRLMDEMNNIADDYRDEKNQGDFLSELKVWAKKYPIKDLNFHRRSTLDLMAKTLGSEEYSLGSTVGNIAISVNDIKDQITLYTDLLPKQIKWQAQYAAYEIFGDTTVGNLMGNFNTITQSASRISNVVEETTSLIEDLQQSTLDNINNQRLSTLEAVKQERIAVLEAITAERIAILEDINGKKDETIEKLEDITNNVMNRSSIFAADIIDTIFWRTLILFAVVFLGLILLLRIKKQIEK